MTRRMSIQEVAEYFEIGWGTARRMLVESEKDGKVLEWTQLGRDCAAIQNPITGRITIDSDRFNRSVAAKLAQISREQETNGKH
jgi:hypothetical protein